MKNFKQKVSRVVILSLAVFVLLFAAFAQQIKRTPFDVKHYKMDVKLDPASNKIDATVDIDIVPSKETRVVTFELNGSLIIEEISIISKLPSALAEPTPTPTPVKRSRRGRRRPTTTATPKPVNNVTFVQDRVGVSDLGPSVRIDLGEIIPANTPIKLRFKYKGVLVTPEGGPLLTKRLAYIGPNDGYLMYAARWFPFHDYAADKATSDISISLPDTFQVVGYSDVPVLNAGGNHRFVQSKESLVGNFSYGRYASKTLRYAGYELQFNTKAGNEKLVAEYGAILGKALEYYSKRFGTPAMGKKLIITQIDDESLDYYSQHGMLFLANRHFNASRPIIKERLQREAAFQWWD